MTTTSPSDAVPMTLAGTAHGPNEPIAVPRLAVTSAAELLDLAVTGDLSELAPVAAGLAKTLRNVADPGRQVIIDELAQLERSRVNGSDRIPHTTTEWSS